MIIIKVSNKRFGVIQMKFTFGKLNEDGSKSCYLKKGDKKIFVCWFSPKYDMLNPDGGYYETPTQAMCQMIYRAGYNGLEDYWNTNIKKVVN
jgi:hypothetical protein